ncbi:MAG TPA: S41 family peptidase [Pelolinea sp.]|nr:S41 family peptidase [Pelolinea sp.]
MNKNRIIILGGLLSLSLIFSACGLLAGNQTSVPSGDAVPESPVLITGEFEYTNDFVVETYYVEHAVGLLDLTGFVLRDKEWELPVDSQVLGYMDLDAENNRATFRLALPAVPEGEFNDVDQDARKEQGLQVFVVGYNPNLTGGVFSEGDDRSLGWPVYLASVTTDSENQDEITGGKLVIWAADGSQEFPSGFGTDGLLFSADDPIVSVPAGYSIVDLDKKPFELVRSKVVEMALYEPEDIAVKDYSGLSYSEAFDKMYEVIRKEYAFNGIQGKQLDWDAAYAELAPRVAAAQEARDPYAYYLVLRDLMMKFKDGHVGFNGGDLEGFYIQEKILGGWGFAVKELDNKRVIVVYVGPGSPAAQEGLRVGAELIRFNGEPVQDALAKVKPFQPQSTDFGLRNEKTIFLTRSGIGQSVSIEFQNPGQASQTAEMISIQETNSLCEVSLLCGSGNEFVLPAEYQIFLDTGIGYVKLNSHYDDLGLLVRVFEHALKTFEEAGVLGVVIDMRLNFGGAPMGLSGFLYDQDIPLGQLEYYSEKTGQFEPDGPRDKVFPNENQYRFEKMVLLVDQYCFSACEIEAYGFSQVPGMVVMGQFPTAGVEAETARGKFLLPEGMEFNIPTGRFTLPDGSIFLEGKGVQPTVRIPVDEASVLSDEDVVLQEAIDYILGG